MRKGKHLGVPVYEKESHARKHANAVTVATIKLDLKGKTNVRADVGKSEKSKTRHSCLALM